MSFLPEQEEGPSVDTGPLALCGHTGLYLPSLSCRGRGTHDLGGLGCTVCVEGAHLAQEASGFQCCCLALSVASQRLALGCPAVGHQMPC